MDLRKVIHSNPRNKHLETDKHLDWDHPVKISYDTIHSGPGTSFKMPK